MPVENNEQVVRRFYEEVVNGRNLDAVDELLTPNGVDHTFGSQNAEQAKQFFGMIQQAFLDTRVEVYDVIAEGDLVAARVTYTGTHQGEFVGIPRPASRPWSTGSTSFACRTAGRPSSGTDRTCSASWCSWASCPDRAHRDKARPPSAVASRTANPAPAIRRRSHKLSISECWFLTAAVFRRCAARTRLSLAPRSTRNRLGTAVRTALARELGTASIARGQLSRYHATHSAHAIQSCAGVMELLECCATVQEAWCPWCDAKPQVSMGM